MAERDSAAPYYNFSRAVARVSHLGMEFRICPLRRPQELDCRFAGLYGAAELLELPRSIVNPAQARLAFKAWLARRFPEQYGSSRHQLRAYIEDAKKWSFGIYSVPLSPKRLNAPEHEKPGHAAMNRTLSAPKKHKGRPIEHIVSGAIRDFASACALHDFESKVRPPIPRELEIHLSSEERGSVIARIEKHPRYIKTMTKCRVVPFIAPPRRDFVVVKKRRHAIPSPV
ncbi:hypothetical protein [Pseudorhodoplanes sp.]|uniref:hypothetical protein n=1 Tax=Pseudorhodoplanes sp. TaxID=1934341 RepID=UPI003D0C08FA